MRFRNASNQRIRLDSGARMDDDTCCCVECATGCDGPASLLLDMYGITCTPANYDRCPNLPAGEYAIDFHGSSSTSYLGSAFSWSFSCAWIGPVADVMCYEVSGVLETRDVRPIVYDYVAAWMHLGTTGTWRVLDFSARSLPTESTGDTNRPCDWIPKEGTEPGSSSTVGPYRLCDDGSLGSVSYVKDAYTVKVYAP